MKLRVNRIQTITYTQKKMMKLLTTPYKTDCFDYNKLGYKSRKSCIECLIENSVERFNCLSNVNLSPLDPIYGSEYLYPRAIKVILLKNLKDIMISPLDQH